MTDADAEFDLGERYFHGDGVDKSYETALEHYKKADAAGHDIAAISIGWMYHYGEGVKKSDETSKYYFSKAKGATEEELKERFPNVATICGTK